jgi:NAD(P)H-hydrate repair Nnr-like enzyme with NAD(P)H-hydrate epimerase domain
MAKTTQQLMEDAAQKVFKKTRAIIPNNVEVWVHDALPICEVLLGFGEFVATIDKSEIKYVAGLE